MRKLTLDNICLLASMLVTGIFLTELAQAQGIPADWQNAQKDCQQQGQWQICAWPEQPQFAVHVSSQQFAIKLDKVLESEVLVALTQAQTALQHEFHTTAEQLSDSFAIQPDAMHKKDAGQQQIASILEHSPTLASMAIAMHTR